MAQQDIPILVVDDARFSSAMIAKALRSGGFTNVRFTNSPLDALRSIEKRPARILIADWLLPAMDGLELARRVKRLDAESDHLTYVMLLTSRDDLDALERGFREGVDDFLNKADLRGQLLPRVLAAARIAERHNALLEMNRELGHRLEALTDSGLIDPVTGLGNRRFTLARIDELTREVEARGAAACLLLVGIADYAEIGERYGAAIRDELAARIAGQLRALVRPLDVVTRPGANLFAVIMRQPSLECCTGDSLGRVFDKLSVERFESRSAGAVPVTIGVSICGADALTGLPAAQDFMRSASEALTNSFQHGMISVTHF